MPYADMKKAKVWVRNDRRSNPERYREIDRRYAAKHPKTLCATRMLNSARQRARRRGVPFDISRADIVLPEKCPVLGVELDYSPNKIYARPNSPSLDCVNPRLGYVKGNIAVISRKANSIKQNATPDEILAVAGYAAFGLS